MAWKVYRKDAKKLKLLNQEQFFWAVAEAAGYADRDTVKKVYDAIQFVMYKELRQKGAIRFPALFDVRLNLSRGKRIKNHNMPTAMMKPPHHQVRVSPIYTVRRFFKAYDAANPGVIFDPAERIKAGLV